MSGMQKLKKNLDAIKIKIRKLTQEIGEDEEALQMSDAKSEHIAQFARDIKKQNITLQNEIETKTKEWEAIHAQNEQIYSLEIQKYIEQLKKVKTERIEYHKMAHNAASIYQNLENTIHRDYNDLQNKLEAKKRESCECLSNLKALEQSEISYLRRIMPEGIIPESESQAPQTFQQPPDPKNKPMIDFIRSQMAHHDARLKLDKEIQVLKNLRDRLYKDIEDLEKQVANKESLS